MGPRPLPQAIERELEEKVRDFPNPWGATIGRRIFTRQPPSKGAGGGGLALRICTPDVLRRISTKFCHRQGRSRDLELTAVPQAEIRARAKNCAGPHTLSSSSSWTT
jgi:hypothetical protein